MIIYMLNWINKSPDKDSGLLENTLSRLLLYKCSKGWGNRIVIKLSLTEIYLERHTTS